MHVSRANSLGGLMRLTRLLTRLLLASLIPLAACETDLLGPDLDPDAPSNLTYQLLPSGDPDVPLGVLLTWDAPQSGRAQTFDVFGRTGNGQWVRRATTTSPTFHDAGVPQDQYYVAALDQDNVEIGRSEIVRIDDRNRLPAPRGLSSISLSGAIQLSWSSNAYDANPSAFDFYRVYSTAYDAARGVCTAQWSLEGTTVSDGFLVGSLTNGVSRCFAVSAISRDGHESVWSDARLDTPRFDSRNAFVYATTVKRDSAGFLFYDPVARAYGSVGSATRTDVDFIVERRTDGSLWLTPGRTGVTMMLYATTPVADLTSIDRAPTTGFASVTVEAVPGYAYVFRVVEADGVHYAALRVAYRAADYVVFDWSYQSGVGNPELSRSP
jgi:hypothetical protein